jgi:hypothetical protein
MQKPWGSVDPNSAHQRWSRWRFTIEARPPRLPSRDQFAHNFARYVRRLLGTTVGRAQVSIVRDGPAHLYVGVVELEGPDVHDPAYRAWVQREFAGVFVAKGFGPGARLRQMDAILLAGSAEDGKPARQLLVMPPIRDALKTRRIALEN